MVTLGFTWFHLASPAKEKGKLLEAKEKRENPVGVGKHETKRNDFPIRHPQPPIYCGRKKTAPP